ncbi:uncharacterized protein LOC115600747 [Strigops habroptila]|uniref:uncharacterized protein LOC115600747 n=1 Tax=Strigops habroptila TaxID=2489341 RepID=UPI0011CFD636|nr:uncharacterized protein LOC115600747 [Strigops habroptila]
MEQTGKPLPGTSGSHTAGKRRRAGDSPCLRPSPRQGALTAARAQQQSARPGCRQPPTSPPAGHLSPHAALQNSWTPGAPLPTARPPAQRTAGQLRGRSVPGDGESTREAEACPGAGGSHSPAAASRGRSACSAPCSSPWWQLVAPPLLLFFPPALTRPRRRGEPRRSGGLTASGRSGRAYGSPSFVEGSLLSGGGRNVRRSGPSRGEEPAAAAAAGGSARRDAGLALGKGQAMNSQTRKKHKIFATVSSINYRNTKLTSNTAFFLFAGQVQSCHLDKAYEQHPSKEMHQGNYGSGKL